MSALLKPPSNMQLRIPSPWPCAYVCTCDMYDGATSWPHMGACDGPSAVCLKGLALTLFNSVKCHIIVQYSISNNMVKYVYLRIYTRAHARYKHTSCM